MAQLVRLTQPDGAVAGVADIEGAEAKELRAKGVVPRHGVGDVYADVVLYTREEPRRFVLRCRTARAPHPSDEVYLEISPGITTELLAREDQEPFAGMPEPPPGGRTASPAAAAPGEVMEDGVVVRRMNALPEDRVLLEDMLRQVGRYLEATGPAYSRWVQWSNRVRSDPLARLALIPALREAEVIDQLEQELSHEEPLDQQFWDYAEWPFSWVSTADQEQSRRNLLESLDRWVESLSWPALPGIAFVEVALGLRREIYEVLRAPGRPAGGSGSAAPVDPPESYFGGRIGVDPASKAVIFDGHDFVIQHPAVFSIFRKLAQAEGAIVSKREIERLPACKGRFDQLLKEHLQGLPLFELIDSKPGNGGGYWLRLPLRK